MYNVCLNQNQNLWNIQQSQRPLSGVRVHSAPKVFQDKFQHLQKSCPIVEAGDSFEYKHCKLPTNDRNYTYVDPNKVKFFVAQKEAALPYLGDILRHSNNEAQVTETLYILDRMIENGTKGIDKMYPILSRFNDTKSPNIQTFLAGIYRKTLVPDAFGPLIKMLIQNSINPQPAPFDPNEEIGGAILEYIAVFKSKKN